MIALKFRLDINDEWPPVGVESLWFDAIGREFKVLDPPLFIKDLSVGDVIAIKQDSEGFVIDWYHVSRSARTIIWILRLAQPNEIDLTVQKLRRFGCNSVRFDAAGVYSIDVPEDISIAFVDSVLESLDKEKVAIAFASMRHQE